MTFSLILLKLYVFYAFGGLALHYPKLYFQKVQSAGGTFCKIGDALWYSSSIFHLAQI